MTEYYVPTGPGDAEYVEKRSKFLEKCGRWRAKRQPGPLSTR